MTPRDRSYIYLLIGLCFAVAMLAGCKPPAPPKPDGDPKKPTVLLVPGLGDGQLYSVEKRLREVFGDRVTVVSFDTGRHNYLSDVAKYANENPHGSLAVVGHSYGCSKLSVAMPKMGPVALAVFLDPVREVGHPPLAFPADTGRALVITGDFSGLIRANVGGVFDEYKVHAGHSAVAHQKQTLDIVERELAVVLK